MKKITLGNVIISIAFVLFIIAFVLIAQQNERLKQERQELKDEIQELNREIGELQAMDSFWEEYIDLLDEIYQGKINEAVLQERVKWLEKINNSELYSDDYVYQLLEDFDDVIEIIIYYYKNTDQVVALETYIETNYPALYDRLYGYLCRCRIRR